MKKNYLDKFLYGGFKFGKIFAVLVLFLILIVMIVSIVFLLKFNSDKIETPQFSAVRQAIEVEEASAESYSSSSDSYVPSVVIKKEAAEKKYKQQIEDIVNTLNLKPFAYDLILSNIINYDEKYQDQYVKGLKPFLQEGIDFVKTKYNAKMEDISVQKYYLPSLLSEYNGMFNSEIERIADEKLAQTQNRLTAAYVLGISILLFIICLFLPLIIKIEENTRQLVELKKEEKNA